MSGYFHETRYHFFRLAITFVILNILRQQEFFSSSFFCNIGYLQKINSNDNTYKIFIMLNNSVNLTFQLKHLRVGQNIEDYFFRFKFFQWENIFIYISCVFYFKFGEILNSMSVLFSVSESAKLLVSVSICQHRMTCLRTQISSNFVFPFPSVVH